MADLAGRPRFWSDDFDMDLLKVVPIEANIVSALERLDLWTHGGETYGRLNHPSVWNGDDGCYALFSTRPTVRLGNCWTNSPVVKCNALEAFRDAWAHNYLMYVNGLLIWNTEALWPEFETIMWRIRDWGRTDAERNAAVKRSLCSANKAAALLRSMMQA